MDTRILPAIGGSIAWSLHPAIVSRYSESIKPLTFSGLKALAAFAFTIAIMHSLPGFGDGFPYVLASAILEIGLGDALYAQSIKFIGGSLAVTISYSYIFTASAFSAIFFGEQLKLPLLIGLALAFTGIIVSVNPFGSLEKRALRLKGILAAVATSILWGAGTSLVKPALKYYNFASLTATRMLVVSLLLTPIGVAFEKPRDNWLNMVKASILVGSFSLGLGTLLLTYSIGTIGVAYTVLVESLTPILSQITTRTISREKLAANTITGAILVGTGIVISNLKI
jgi:drug/metabolite transporter (DMT)-like permease